MNKRVFVIGIFVILLITNVIPVTSKSLTIIDNTLGNKKINFPQNLDILTWEWASQAGGTFEDCGFDITTDPNGNIYVTGGFNKVASFGDIVLTSSGGRDFYVAKLDSNGNWLWAKQVGDSGLDHGSGIFVEPDGTCYVAGTFSGTVNFGNTVLTSRGHGDIFVAKIDSNGNWIWAQQAGGSSYYDNGNSINLDSNGDIIISGSIHGTAYFGSIVVTGYGGWDIIVAKLDPDGNWLWVRNAGGSGGEDGRDSCLDSNDNIYVSGLFASNTARFGNTVLTNNGGHDGFIAKLDTNGSWLWAKNFGGKNYEDCYTIHTDPNGTIYTSGVFDGKASFGNIVLTSYGGWDVFVAKLDSDGNWLWVRNAGGYKEDDGRDIVIDSYNNIYITGTFTEYANFGDTVLTSARIWDYFVAKLDTNGNWKWALSPSSGGGELIICIGDAITLDYENNVITTGYFAGTVRFGDFTMTSYGHYDVFVVKLNQTIVNEPPNTPTIKGPSTGKPEQNYDYKFKANDPDYNNIYLYIEWGDGTVEEWIGPYESSEEVTLSHTWKSQGSYTIKAKAKDSDGAESEWGTFTVKITKNRAKNKPTLLNIFEKIINYSPILKLLSTNYKNASL